MPIKPKALITLLNELELDVLRPAKWMVHSLEDCNLYFNNVKCNAHSSATPKSPSTVQELLLKEFQGEGERLVQLFRSGLVEGPKSIGYLDAGAFQACGPTFRQYLDRNATWQSLKASSLELTPIHRGMASHGVPSRTTRNQCPSAIPQSSWATI